jgi:hypothetical protein
LSATFKQWHALPADTAANLQAQINEPSEFSVVFGCPALNSFYGKRIVFIGARQ